MRKLLLGIAVSAYLVVGIPAEAASPTPLNRPLKASQVACAARQLGRVQFRMATYGSGLHQNGDWGFNPGGSILTLSHTALGGGVFSGVARTFNFDTPCADFHAGFLHFAEADLAFELLFKMRTDLLDPRHPRIPQATLVRRDWGTNFGLDNANCPGRVLPDLTCPIILSLDLAVRANDRLIPVAPIYLNSARAAVPDLNDPGAEPRGAVTGRGPGILNDDLSEACGGTLTDFDHRVFEILARTIVPSDAFVTLVPPRSCAGVPRPVGFALTLFRGVDPQTFRANIYSYENNSEEGVRRKVGTIGPVIAIEFKINWDREGRLTTGTARVLPTCRTGQDLDCTSDVVGLGLFIVPPIFPGHEEEPSSAFQNAPYLNFTGTANSPANVLTTTIDWADLLRNTALNSP